MQVSFLSIPVYSMLPAAQEWVIERGWTRAYSRVASVGLARHIAYFVAFMACVEFGVYWMHRLLHDIRVGYRCAGRVWVLGLLGSLALCPTGACRLAPGRPLLPCCVCQAWRSYRQPDKRKSTQQLVLFSR